METKLYRQDLAERIGVKVDSLNKLKLPERDGTDIERGKARPFWYESTVEAWRAARPGKGFRSDLAEASR